MKFPARKLPRGRPAADGIVEGGRASLTIKVSADERAAFEAAAAREGAKQGKPITVSTWIRLVCGKAAGK